MGPNYLIEILSFQEKLMYQTIELSTGQINLWYALMAINNKSGWKKWFTATNKVLSLLTGLSRSGIEKARKKLKDLGLIDYKTNGTNATAYTMCLLCENESIQDSIQDRIQDSIQDSIQDRIQDRIQNRDTLVKQNKTKQNKTKKDILSDKSDRVNSKKSKNSEAIKTIIDYLNSATNSSYRSTTKSNQKKINARLEEGFTVDDFKKVIDKKKEDWKGTDMAKFLRPETLFGTKFEGYLNAPISKPSGKNWKRKNFEKPVPKWFDEKQEDYEPETKKKEINLEDMPF